MDVPVVRFQSQSDWKHCVFSKVFDDKLIELIINNLKRLDWLEVEHSFYKQREYDLLEDQKFKEIFNSDRIKVIREIAENYFCINFKENVSVVAHKMISGDYIGIHTDENDFGETHRLTLLLNEDWSIEDGGIFLTLEEHNLESISSAWLPKANTGVLFEICNKSFHAVTPIAGNKERLSIIFTFSEKSTRENKTKWMPFPLEEDLEHAKSTAKYMNLKLSNSSVHLYFDKFKGFLDYFGYDIKNTPINYSYIDSDSINVDQNGEQSKGSDLERIEKISGLKYIAPIILVKSKDEYTLVDGSHRLSYAKDNNSDISVVVFEEK